MPRKPEDYQQTHHHHQTTQTGRQKGRGTVRWFHWLLLACYATALPTWFLDYGEMTRLDWIIRDLREYSLMPCLYFLCYWFIPYKYFAWKLFSWLSGWLAVYNLANYLIWVNYPDWFDRVVWSFYPLMAVVAFLFMVNRIRENKIRVSSSTYDPSKTYIARKMPTSIKALAASIAYQWPVDTMSIIHEGHWYKMKGRFREVPLNMSKLAHYYLEEISPDGVGDRVEMLMKERRRFNLVSWNCFRSTMFVAGIKHKNPT